MTAITPSVILSSALRSNILSLQATQSQIDETELRIATGLKVRSPIDNPNNFFQARALSFRASSLSGLLDSIGQSISTIQAASTAVTSLQSLVQQAQAITNQAQSTLTSNTQEARINGNVNLSNISNLPASVSGIDANDRLLFNFVQPDNSISVQAVVISNGTSTNNLINNINSILDSGGSQVLAASLDTSGGLQIRDVNGNRFETSFMNAGGGPDSTLASALGFSDLSITVLDNNNSQTRVTISSTASLTTVGLFAQNGGAGGTTATASTSLVDLTDSATGFSGDIFRGGTNDQINIGVNGSTTRQVVGDLITSTLQGLIDGINNNAGLNTQIEASFDSSSGTLNIRAIGDTVRSIQFELVEGNTFIGPAPRFRLETLGIGTRNLTTTNSSGNTSSESIELGASAGALAALEIQFGTVLSQLDQLVTDSAFSGTNLLNGDNLITFFNESRSSSLTTTGRSLTSNSLGINQANFGNSTSIGGSLTETTTATGTLTNFSSSLSNNLSIIQTRETFTNDTINTLQEGADKLTIADQNEEGAKLILLQSRQLLGVTALALGSQAQASTLRLFPSP